jgi:hypothetical protein
LYDILSIHVLTFHVNTYNVLLYQHAYVVFDAVVDVEDVAAVVLGTQILVNTLLLDTPDGTVHKPDNVKLVPLGIT